MLQQLSLLPTRQAPEADKHKTSGTFIDNLKLPVHRWFRYSAGFSAEWVRSVLREYKPVTVLDPFAGSGTTLLAAAQERIECYGFESHPFVGRIANAKLAWNTPVKDIHAYAELVMRKAKTMSIDISEEPPLLLKCYTEEALITLCALRESFSAFKEAMPSRVRKLLWLAITAILRPCSHAGTAQWQYVLPTKTKARVVAPLEAFREKVDEIVTDMELFQQAYAAASSHLIHHDARARYESLDGQIDLVITSPPYPNNYDYGDATRLEMTFWHEIRGWGDLQSTVRKHLVRSCSQHAAADKLILEPLLGLPRLVSIQEEISTICHTLAAERLHHGGKKPYHLMVAAYFADLAAVFISLRKACRKGCRMCFVIGDSAPYGIYVPVDEFLGKLAISAGFTDYSFEKLRDRNIKWKNRKHRVPLQEGRLWIEG